MMYEISTTDAFVKRMFFYGKVNEEVVAKNFNSRKQDEETI